MREPMQKSRSLSVKKLYSWRKKLILKMELLPHTE